jgi:hypothetical protein
MKNPEEAIDKVLAGLRDAEAPAGMEGRILGALEERAAARAGSGWRIWRVLPGVSAGVRYLTCGAALAGLFAIALAIPAIRRIGRPGTQTKVTMAAVKTVTSSAVDRDMKASPANHARPLLNTPGMRIVEMSAPEAGATESSDEIAMSEMLAPSHPAPPMPLTDQERLLMRLVRGSDQVELAMLESKLDALKDAEEKAEFQRFFAQPTTVQPTTDDPGAKQTPPAPTQPEQTPSAQSQPEQSKPEHSTTGDNK